MRLSAGTAAMFSLKILSVGYERELLRLRSLLLRQSLTVEVLEAVELAQALRIVRGKERIAISLCSVIASPQLTNE